MSKFLKLSAPNTYDMHQQIEKLNAGVRKEDL